MTERPRGLADRPDLRAGGRGTARWFRGELPMDPLSDLLRTVRLSGAVFFDVTASDPWVAESPAGETIVTGMFPGSDHLISYHVVTEGECWATGVGLEPVKVSAGEVVVFPHGHGHTMSSTPGMRSTPNLSNYRRPTEGHLPFTMSVGDSGAESAHLVCGFLGCDSRPFNPLLDALPPVIRVDDRQGGALGRFVEFAMRESRESRIGGECVLDRLSELMFVDVVRRYLETLPPDRSGWLAALRDPFVGKALTALHRSPARPWTLEGLSREVGLSRSALAERFAELAGQPPMQYLASWRMQLAANALTTSADSLAAIAERVGYESEAAFSRAFRKQVGVPPGQWRKERRT